MATQKACMDVFGRFVYWQRVYQYRDINTFKYYINSAYWDNLLSQCKQSSQLSDQMCKLFSLKSRKKLKRSDDLVNNGNAVLEKLLNHIENDFLELIDYLGSHHFSDPDVNEQQVADNVTNVYRQYVEFFNTLFHHPDEFTQNEYLFSVANKVFNFCFENATHGIFLRMQYEDRYYPLSRLIQTILSNFLSVEAWNHWHVDSLMAIKKASDSGKTIVYVGGGTDIYQLLISGIYTIEVIDPILPSQAGDYYSEGWLWLVEGEIGDTLYINDNLVLRRDAQQLFDTFKAATASGDIIEVPHTETRWSVHDIQSQKVIGRVVYKRRFARQDDFMEQPSKALLASFNELYLFGAPPYRAGWGIDVLKIQNNMPIFVKQIRHPITGVMLKRLTLTNYVPFQFSNLGGCAT